MEDTPKNEQLLHYAAQNMGLLALHVLRTSLQSTLTISAVLQA
jgi:hypothetical protein